MMNPFRLVRLDTLERAKARVAEAPTARVFRAGGIDLLDRMKEGIDAPDELVELHAIAGEHGRAMRGVSETEDGGWRIGALVTLGQLAAFDDLPDAHAALRQAAGQAATPGIRNAATLGGNLLQRPRCWYYRHADLDCMKKGGALCLAVSGDNRYHAIFGGGPSYIVHPSSLAPALLALDAEAVVWRDGQTRVMPLDELFALPTVDPEREHTLGPGDVLLELRLPPPTPGGRSSYVAAREKQSHDWPLVEAAVRCSVVDGKLRDVRVALGQVAPIPWRATQTEQALEGRAPDADAFGRAAEAETANAEPLEHNAYKIPLVRGLIRHALHAATAIALPE
jgi:xanthine dehydrogenase YagS FAD-binding subunit